METKPFKLDQTHQMGRWDNCHDAELNIEDWDSFYQYRATKFRDVAICRIWKDISNLIDPFIIKETDLNFIFNRIPRTQNPPKFTDDEWQRFLNWLKI